jgi:hypothetical protein
MCSTVVLVWPGFANNLLAQLNLVGAREPGAMVQQMMTIPLFAQVVPPQEGVNARRPADPRPPRNVRARIDRRTGRGGPDGRDAPSAVAQASGAAAGASDAAAPPVGLDAAAAGPGELPAAPNGGGCEIQ